MDELNGFHPLGDYVVVRQDTPDEKTAGGLYIPEEAQEKPLSGTVVAVGPGTFLKKRPTVRAPMLVAVGDRVVFDQYAPRNESARLSEKYFPDKSHVILHEPSILGIVEETETQTPKAAE